MNYREWAAIGHACGWLGVRNEDGATSTAGAKAIKVRAGSQRELLLGQYSMCEDLTDEEAGRLSGLLHRKGCCYWKRCSELRQAGYIKPTGEMRLADTSVLQQVCKITEEGMQALARAEAESL